jgi:hypothetical protein
MHSKCSNTFWADFVHQNFHSHFSVTIQHFVLDSMTNSVHRYSYYASCICKWLNFVWVGPPCFDSLPLILPTVPKERGCCNCSIFVCRYVYSLFQMRHQNFNTYSEKSTFKTLIAMDPAFQFKQSDMETFRNKIATLIGNLSKIYLMSDKIKGTKIIC